MDKRGIWYAQWELSVLQYSTRLFVMWNLRKLERVWNLAQIEHGLLQQGHSQFDMNILNPSHSIFLLMPSLTKYTKWAVNLRSIQCSKFHQCKWINVWSKYNVPNQTVLREFLFSLATYLLSFHVFDSKSVSSSMSKVFAIVRQFTQATVLKVIREIHAKQK